MRRPILSRLILIFFLVILAFAGMESTFALWAMRQFRWGPEQVGYVFAYVGVLSAILQGGLIGRLAQRFGEERLLLCGLVLICVGLLVLPFARDLPLLGLGVSGLALGMGLTQPSLNSLISRRAGRDGAGRGAGRLAIGRQPCPRRRARSGRDPVFRSRPQQPLRVGSGADRRRLSAGVQPVSRARRRAARRARDRRAARNEPARAAGNAGSAAAEGPAQGRVARAPLARPLFVAARISRVAGAGRARGCLSGRRPAGQHHRSVPL